MTPTRTNNQPIGVPCPGHAQAPEAPATTSLTPSMAPNQDAEPDRKPEDIWGAYQKFMMDD